MIYIASHAAGLLLLLVLFQSTGWLAARAIPAIDRVGRRTGLIRVATGIAIWVYLLFLLATIQMLRWPVLAAAALAVFVTSGVVLARHARRAGVPDPHAGRDDRWPVTAHAIAWLAPAYVLALLFLSGLSPWVGWDALVAHLALPKIYLLHGGFRRVPFNAYSNWPLNVELLYTLAMAGQDYVLAKLVHVGVLGLLTAGVYRAASRAAAPWAGVVAAALLLANDIVQVEAVNGDIDIAVAFFFFMAVTQAIEFRETGERTALVMSGVFCGCMAGSKITGLASIACVLPLILVGTLSRNTDRRLRSATRDVALLVAPALVLAMPWLIKSFLYTGDPLYPVFSKYLGGVEWSATIDQQFWRWQQSIGKGRTFRDYVLLPARVILRGGDGYPHFAALINKSWILFVPLSVMASPAIALVRRCLVPAGLYFVVWALTSQQSRFLISVLPLLSVAAAVTISWTVTFVSARLGGRDSGHARVRARVVYGALTAMSIAGSLVILGWGTRYIVKPTVRASRELIAHPPDLQRWVPHPVYAVIRDDLPASARIMLIDTNQGFFVDRDYLADSFFEASLLNERITTATQRGGLPAFFAHLGVTHVLVEHAAWVPFPPALWHYLDDPASSKPVFRDGSFTLYELTALPSTAGM